MITSILQLPNNARKVLRYLAADYLAQSDSSDGVVPPITTDRLLTSAITTRKLSDVLDISITNAKLTMDRLVATKLASTEKHQGVTCTRYYHITQHGLDVVNDCVAVPEAKEKKAVQYYTPPKWEPARSDALKFLEIPSRSAFSKE